MRHRHTETDKETETETDIETQRHRHRLTDIYNRGNCSSNTGKHIDRHRPINRHAQLRHTRDRRRHTDT